MTQNNNSNTLEKAVAELDSIVEKMESGDLSLDESLKLFEKGVKLTRFCQNNLAQAEAKIEQLMQQIKE